MIQEKPAARTCVAARGGMGARRWPRQDLLELGAFAGAVPCARLHARKLLRDWGFTSTRSLCEAAELLVAELVANAVTASRAAASPVRLWLVSDPAQIVILVWDASPSPPVRVDVGDEAESGRGLMLVEAISEQWGWCPCEDSGGKFVWASLVRLCPPGVGVPAVFGLTGLPAPGPP